MASVIDSFRDLCGERLFFLKFILLTIPVYYSYQLYMSSKNDFTTFWIIAGLTAFFIFGFVIQITNNLINERNEILPSFNPFLTIFAALKGLVALGPVILLCSFLANLICSTINIIEWVDFVLKFLIWLTAVGFIGTSFLMFSAKENISDAFNLKLLFSKAGDFIIASIFFIIQFAFVNVVTVGFIGYILFILTGFGPFFDFFVALAVVFNLAALGHFLGQAHYELVGHGNN